jgi:hypothetical protein
MNNTHNTHSNTNIKARNKARNVLTKVSNTNNKARNVLTKVENFLKLESVCIYIYLIVKLYLMMYWLFFSMVVFQFIEFNSIILIASRLPLCLYINCSKLNQVPVQLKRNLHETSIYSL